jgi:hypothetical protein
MQFSDWLFARVGRTDSIALVRLMELLFQFLTRERQLDPALVAPVLWSDYQRGGRRDKPGFLVEHLRDLPESPGAFHRSGPRRQGRHAAVPGE